RAVMWMAVTRQRQDRIPEADGLFNDAINRQPSRATGNAMEMYARLMQQQGRDSDAAAMRARAQDAWKSFQPPSKSASGTSASAYRVGGGVAAPSLLWKMEPEYSEEARATKNQGTVVLYVEVTPEGQASNVRV